MKQWCCAGALVATFIAAGCEDMRRVPEPADDPAQRFASFEASYRIGVDDRVQIVVWRNPEVSVTAPVRPDGKISVPIIGDVEAGGHTPSEVSEIIKKRLSEYIREPNVARARDRGGAHPALDAPPPGNDRARRGTRGRRGQ